MPNIIEPFDKQIAIANAMKYQNKHYKLLTEYISNLMLRINEEIKIASLKGNRYCKISIDNFIGNCIVKTENMSDNKTFSNGDLDAIIDAIKSAYQRKGYCVCISSDNQYRSVDMKNNCICVIHITIEW
jgi:hypothetical protein